MRLRFCGNMPIFDEIQTIKGTRREHKAAARMSIISRADLAFDFMGRDKVDSGFGKTKT